MTLECITAHGRPAQGAGAGGRGPGAVGQGSRATIFAESADWIPYIFSFIDFGRYYSVGVRFFGFSDFCS